MTDPLPLLVLATIIGAATPLLYAALGELVAERAGVLNLGVEGMMLAGAVAGFAGMDLTGSHALAVLAAALAGGLLAVVFALLALTLTSAQVPTGLALTIFGIGLSALAGAGFTGRAVAPLPKLDLGLPPPFGALLRHDALVYLSLALTAAVAWFLARTRVGLVLRSVGEGDAAAHALGHPVLRLRWGATLFGGLMAGLGGGYLSLAVTPLWAEEMTAGRGWIALALVVFAAWRPWRLLAGAYLFGGLGVLQLYLQGAGLLALPSQLVATLPYLATVAVLVVLSARGRAGAPASLGRPFRPT